jgi:hypothetical protein
VPTRRSAVAALAVAGAVALGGCSGGAEPAEPTGSASSQAPATTGTAGTTAATATGSPTETATDSAVGELVEGFPTDVVPVLPGAEVTVSAVVPSEGRRQVTLAGETTQAADAVLRFYRDALVAQGFTETSPTQPSGVVGATFSRGEGGADILTLTVTSSGGAQQFTIGGFLAG